MGELIDTTQIESDKLEINDDFKNALNYLENTKRSLFITGKAGSGKSTLINHFRNTTKKNHIVLAPTGVAAVNVKGQTIHSFFKLPFGILDKDEIGDLLYQGREGLQDLEMIIIDESSMIRCDIIDAIDSICRAQGPERTTPFGGIQMIFVGDLYQLPPVVTGNDLEYFSQLYPNPFFFSANVFKDLKLVPIELKKIYRQQGDIKFLNLLEKVRNNTVAKPDLDELNKRVKVRYDGEEEEAEEDFVITLTTTNEKSRSINEERLAKIPTKRFVVYASVIGTFPKDSFPTEEELILKPEAQILMIKNDPQGRWCNGTLGKVVEFLDEGSEKKIVVQLKNNDGMIETYKIGKETWQNIKYEYDKVEKRMKRKVVGEFKQYPMKLAFAITGHKSQGQTYDAVQLHFGKGCFASGQAYVMLSRCRTLDGIRLLTEIRRRDIFTDRNVLEFIRKLRGE